MALKELIPCQQVLFFWHIPLGGTIYYTCLVSLSIKSKVQVASSGQLQQYIDMSIYHDTM